MSFELLHRRTPLAVALAVSLLTAGAATAQAPAPIPSSPAPSAPPTAPTMAIGPYGLPNGAEIEPGLLVAGQPTAEQLAAVVQAGYKTVIDLRPPTDDRGFDEPAHVASLGATYVNVPVTLETLDAATIARFREVFAKAQQPVFLHCSSSNRVGALYYAHLVLDEKVAPEEALKRGQAAGLKAPPLAEKIQALVAAEAGKAPAAKP